MKIFLLQTLEYVHITQKEKDVAEDLLLNGYMLTKQCRNLEKIKTENFYQLKLPLEGVNTIRYGERCKKYLACVAGGISRVRVFVLVAKP